MGIIIPKFENQDYNEGISTGVIEGGDLSIGAGINTFSISDGHGFIQNGTPERVEWSGLTDIVVTNIAIQLITFVSIDNTGSVIQQSTEWTESERRSRIAIGVVVHVNNVNVNAINDQQATTKQVVPQLHDLMEAIGFINVEGNVFSENGANLSIDKSSGHVMSRGANWAAGGNDNPHILPLASLTAPSFTYRFQNSAAGPSGAFIDPDIYDVGGVSTPVPVNKWSIQRIFSFLSNGVAIQPGQATYNSLSEAKANLSVEPFVVEPSILANGFIRSFLIVKEGAIDLSDPAEALFIAAGKIGNGFTGSSSGAITEFSDNTFRILDNADSTKKLSFEVSDISTTTTREVSMPNEDIDLTPGTGSFAKSPSIGNLDFSNATILDIVATTHDLALTALDGWRITLSGGGQNITGVVAPVPAAFDVRFILNVDATNGLQIVNEGALSVAGNRFALPNGANDNLDPGGVLVIWYDATSLRWRILDYQ